MLRLILLLIILLVMFTDIDSRLDPYTKTRVLGVATNSLTHPKPHSLRAEEIANVWIEEAVVEEDGRQTLLPHHPHPIQRHPSIHPSIDLQPSWMTRRLRFCALIWLVLWLAFSTVRQVFDLVGKLWALVLIDMVQLLAIVSGLFALCQANSMPCRNRLLTTLTLFSALSVAHNVALLLWFCTDLLVADHRQSDLLSFGLPFGHSFFLRHTPLCQAQFNLSAQRWEQQQSHCPIPYSHLEGGQAVLHTLMALGTLLLVVTILLGNRRRHGTRAERPVCKLGFAEERITAGGCAVSASTNELSSSYMDPSCFEEAFTAQAMGPRQFASGQIMPLPPAPPMVGIVRRSYPRAGRRPAAGSGECQQRSRRSNLQKKSAHHRQAAASTPIVPVPPVLHERYSSLSTAGATDVGGGPTNQRAVSNSNNNTASSSSTSSAYGGDNTIASSGSSNSRGYHHHQQALLPKGRQSFYAGVGPPGRIRSPCYSRTTTAQQKNFGQVDGSVQQQYQQRQYRRGGSMRTFCVPEPNDAERAAGSTISHRTFSPPTSSPQSTSSYYGLPRGAGGNASSNNMTSLISFDPKSNTLIRVREHRRSSSSDEADENGSGVHESFREADVDEQQQDGHENTNNKSVPSSPAPDLPPSCPPARSEELLHPHLVVPQQQRKNWCNSPGPLRQRVPSMAGGVGSVMFNSAASMGQANFSSGNGGQMPGYNSQRPSNAPNNGYGTYGTQQIDLNTNNICHNDKTSTSSATAAIASTASIYEAYVGAAVPLDAHTAFPALIGQPPRRSLVDCSAASIIRLSQSDLRSPAIIRSSADECSNNKQTKLRPPGTNETMLGMFV
uniref:Sodium/potassium-transporting ATPase subunit beta-1-interacting protein n=1 Tax=Globodera rostochiensis TaxID=31243 RepID=A0A914HEA0_GLORO